ncbi:TolB family protein [Rhodanobacter lindaniclasticus]
MSKRALLSASLCLLALPALAPAGVAATAPVDPRIEQVLTELGKAQSIQATAISPDGRQLAWVIRRDGKPAIEVADADGRHARRVSAAATPGSCAESGIAWAPDSRHLAFVSNCNVDLTSTQAMRNDIYLADTRGSAAPARLAALQATCARCSGRHDGKSLGFLYVAGATRHASADAAAKPAVGEIDVTGVEMQHVASLDVASGAVHELTPAALYAYEFDWSPDGTRLAYTAAKPPGDDNWSIAKLYMQPAQPGADATVLVDPADTASGSLHGLQIALPRWSPDGSRIAFIGGLMSDQGSTGGDIYAVPAGGGALVDLTPGIKVTPSWLRWTSPRSMLVSQVSNGQSQLADYRRRRRAGAAAARALHHAGQPRRRQRVDGDVAVRRSQAHRLRAKLVCGRRRSARRHVGRYPRHRQ